MILNTGHLKYIFKPILLFFSANALNFILHELSHAVAAYLLGIRSTMYHIYVNPDTANATSLQNLVIAVTGPIFSLLLGVGSWMLYKVAKKSTFKMLALYMAVFGVSIFFGNMLSAAFEGDFHNAFSIIHAPALVQYSVSILGLIAICTFMYLIGAELTGFYINEQTPFLHIVFYTIISPWLLGTALVIFVYLPLPGRSIVNLIIESAFWIFAILGAYKSKVKRVVKVFSPLNWIDISLAIFTVLIVRVMMVGIDFIP